MIHSREAILEALQIVTLQENATTRSLAAGCPRSGDRAVGEPWRRGEIGLHQDSAAGNAPSQFDGLFQMLQIRIRGETVHERRQVTLDDAPKNVQVDGILPVDEAVPQTYDLRSWDVREAGTSLTRNLLRCLTDDLETSDKRKAAKAVCIEILASPSFHQLDGLPCVFEHVPQDELTNR